jgi:hypothetical protein
MHRKTCNYRRAALWRGGSLRPSPAGWEHRGFAAVHLGRDIQEMRVIDHEVRGLRVGRGARCGCRKEHCAAAEWVMR